jgi:hypothetical protein
MRSRSRESNRILNRFLEELGEPLPSTVRTRRASNRVLENLSSLDTFLEPEAGTLSLPRAVSDRFLPARRWLPVTAIAAALFAGAVFIGTLSLPSNAQPIARRLDGKLPAAGDTSTIREGQILRSGKSGSEVLALRDSSRVEMGAGVELSIDRASDGIRIELAEGNIIVTAAKQHDGHLYVKTKDCVVSVVGTVFSVKAEASGSRVAVIEGEVHVQHGDVSQTLLPGQQVSTNSEMKAVPLQTEIGWSQDAVEHVAMLQQSTTPAGPAATIQTEVSPVNPDLVGEIRTILAPAGQVNNGEPAVRNRTFFYSQALGQAPVPADPANNAWGRTGRVFWATPANGFSFTITGIQGRTISFSNNKGETFSYGCADCSFLITETGVTKVTSSTDPGIEFKLSTDGSMVTATCHSASCSQSQTVRNVRWILRTQNATVNNSPGFGAYQSTPGNLQSATIPVSQLVPQPNNAAGAAVPATTFIFTVTK